MQTILPASDQLFCKPVVVSDRTESGLYLGAAVKAPQIAEVLNLGSDVKEFVSGDKVIYKPYAVMEVELNGDKYLLLSEKDILGTVLEVKED